MFDVHNSNEDDQLAEREGSEQTGQHIPRMMKCWQSKDQGLMAALSVSRSMLQCRNCLKVPQQMQSHIHNQAPLSYLVQVPAFLHWHLIQPVQCLIGVLTPPLCQTCCQRTYPRHTRGGPLRGLLRPINHLPLEIACQLHRAQHLGSLRLKQSNMR